MGNSSSRRNHPPDASLACLVHLNMLRRPRQMWVWRMRPGLLALIYDHQFKETRSLDHQVVEGETEEHDLLEDVARTGEGILAMADDQNRMIIMHNSQPVAVIDSTVDLLPIVRLIPVAYAVIIAEDGSSAYAVSDLTELTIAQEIDTEAELHYVISTGTQSDMSENGVHAAALMDMNWSGLSSEALEDDQYFYFYMFAFAKRVYYENSKIHISCIFCAYGRFAFLYILIEIIPTRSSGVRIVEFNEDIMLSNVMSDGVTIAWAGAGLHISPGNQLIQAQRPSPALLLQLERFQAIDSSHQSDNADGYLFMCAIATRFYDRNITIDVCLICYFDGITLLIYIIIEINSPKPSGVTIVEIDENTTAPVMEIEYPMTHFIEANISQTEVAVMVNGSITMNEINHDLEHNLSFFSMLGQYYASRGLMRTRFYMEPNMDAYITTTIIELTNDEEEREGPEIVSEDMNRNIELTNDDEGEETVISSQDNNSNVDYNGLGFEEEEDEEEEENNNRYGIEEGEEGSNNNTEEEEEEDEEQENNNHGIEEGEDGSNNNTIKNNIILTRTEEEAHTETDMNSAIMTAPGGGKEESAGPSSVASLINFFENMDRRGKQEASNVCSSSRATPPKRTRSVKAEIIFTPPLAPSSIMEIPAPPVIAAAPPPVAEPNIEIPQPAATASSQSKVGVPAAPAATAPSQSQVGVPAAPAAPAPRSQVEVPAAPAPQSQVEVPAAPTAPAPQSQVEVPAAQYNNNPQPIVNPAQPPEVTATGRPRRPDRPLYRPPKMRGVGIKKGGRG